MSPVSSKPMAPPNNIKGPKTRPVCSGSNAYNQKFGHLLSMIIRPLWQDEETVCTNTKEVMAGIEEVNRKELETEILVASADVEALYPSLDIDHASEIVAKTFNEREYEFEEIDTRELSLYIALNLKPQELEAENISQYVHRRMFHM